MPNREAPISTAELCLKLGVSRSWVNKYLRHLGIQGPQRLDDRANKRTIYYSEQSIVTLFNSKAIFSRQTELLDLSIYELDKEIIRKLIKKPSSLSKEEWNMINKVIPQDILIVDRPSASARYRGLYPWKKVHAKICSLDQLSTMTRMKEDRSDELVYRENFKFGRIRVEIYGRTWFMAAPKTSDEFSVLILARD